MPLFMIHRKLPGATKEDVDAAGFRAVACAFNYEGLRWLQSYWDPVAECIDCLYEAVDAEQIIDHSRRARIPCDEIREVEYVAPDDYVGSDPSASLEASPSAD